MPLAQYLASLAIERRTRDLKLRTTLLDTLTDSRLRLDLPHRRSCKTFEEPRGVNVPFYPALQLHGSGLR